jgi:hypothetical protein
MMINGIVFVAARIKEFPKLDGLVGFIVMEGFLVKGRETKPKSEDTDKNDRDGEPGRGTSSMPFASATGVLFSLRFSIFCHPTKRPRTRKASRGRERFRD